MPMALTLSSAGQMSLNKSIRRSIGDWSLDRVGIRFWASGFVLARRIKRCAKLGSANVDGNIGIHTFKIIAYLMLTLFTY